MESQTVDNEIVDEENVVDLIWEWNYLRWKYRYYVSLKSRKAKTSNGDYWKVFTKTKKDKYGISKAKCNSCSRILKGSERNDGTTNLNHNMKSALKSM